MSLRLRLLLVVVVVYCVGGYFLTRQSLDQLRPRYLESMEETLVDTSVLLASVLETHLVNNGPDPAELERVLGSAQRREFDARIFSLHKTAIDMRVYVTDAAGRVIYDSAGRDVGKDYSKWNDVYRTLHGAYGARSSRTIPGDNNTQVIYVAAPIRQGDRIIGVLSVGKPTSGVNQLVAVARHRLISGAVIGGLVVLGLLVLLTAWVVTPLERLTAYARAVRDGRAGRLPKLPGRTLRDLGTAFEEMRDSLEGRQQMERYTQTLAHEVKAPLAAIRGAAELLDEAMPPAQRAKFLGNIRSESARIQQIIDRLLELSSLETRKTLQQQETIEIAGLMSEAAAVLRPACATARVTLTVGEVPGAVQGERVLLREALVNLLQNALDFSPAGSAIGFSARLEEGHVVFTVEDRGPGVPDYALVRVFERFYSLPRPGTTRKSTGMGLALVREIAHLHGGEVSLLNRPDGGARAVLRLPVA